MASVPFLTLFFKFSVVMTIHMLSLVINLLLFKGHFRQNLIFCCKARCFLGENGFLSRMIKRVQMYPKRSKMIKKIYVGSAIWIHLEPFGPLWDIVNPAMFGNYWSNKCHYPPHPPTWEDDNGRNSFNPYVTCQRIMQEQLIPELSIFSQRPKQSSLSLSLLI